MLIRVNIVRCGVEILGLQADKARGIIIRALVRENEFEQLQGHLDALCVFATKLITTPTSIIKTGARHSCAKYLLFPAALRRRFKTNEYAFDAISCGVILFPEALYAIYAVPRTATGVGRVPAPPPDSITAITDSDPGPVRCRAQAANGVFITPWR